MSAYESAHPTVIANRRKMLNARQRARRATKTFSSSNVFINNGETSLLSAHRLCPVGGFRRGNVPGSPCAEKYRGKKKRGRKRSSRKRAPRARLRASLRQTRDVIEASLSKSAACPGGPVAFLTIGPHVLLRFYVDCGPRRARDARFSDCSTATRLTDFFCIATQ